MVSSAAEQGRDISRANSDSSMWVVVVLGIISAVFAWVWLGGRGDKKAVENPEKAAETVTCIEPEESQSEVSHSEAPESRDNPPPESTPYNGGASLVSFNETEPVEREGEGDEVHVQSEKPSDKSHQMGEHITSMEDVVVQEVQTHLDVAKKELKQSRVHVHHSAMGLDAQGNQDEGYPCDHGVQELKPSHGTKENLLQTCKHVSDVIVPDKAVPVSAETVTDFVPSTGDVQDDGVTLRNGGIERVQEGTETGNVVNGNALNVAVSSKQVNGSASENNFDHNKGTSCEQSKIDVAPDTEPSAFLESTDHPQANGHLAEKDCESSETCSEEVSVPQELEDVSQAVDQCNILPREEATLDFKGPSFGDGFFSPQSETKLYDLESQRIKRVAAVQPIPQNVSLGFKVHYVTHSDTQIIAVTGDHEKLGEWEDYVPLTSDKDGNWSRSVNLPADANVEWKFVMVENGKIKRWEECNNRHLRTAHEDIAPQQWWGFPEREAFPGVPNLSPWD